MLPAAVRACKPVASSTQVNAFQVQVTGKNVIFYNFAMAHLRTLPGIQSATPQQINPVGTSYILVKYKGDIVAARRGAQRAAAGLSRLPARS